MSNSWSFVTCSLKQAIVFYFNITRFLIHFHTERTTHITIFDTGYRISNFMGNIGGGGVPYPGIMGTLRKHF